MDDFITKAMQLADAMASGSCGDYKARRATLLAHLEGGKSAVLEEAAKVCDKLAIEHDAKARSNWEAFSSHEGEDDASGACESAAAAIRGLAIRDARASDALKGRL